MTAKQSAVKRYVVRLSDEERERLDALTNMGKHPARLLTKARILLKADASEAGEGWSDSRITEALDTSTDTVARTRQQLVEEGFEAVLVDRPVKASHAIDPTFPHRYWRGWGTTQRSPRRQPRKP